MEFVTRERFEELFNAAGIKLLSGEYEKFAEYARFLAEKNAVMNLTAIREPGEVAEKHFLDSVLPLKLCEVPLGTSLCDVGSGAGFPGVPIAIHRPDIKPALIDSLNKRVGFLRELCEKIGVEAECYHLRAEEAGRGALREKFDVATARAVSVMRVLCEYCLPLVKVGGVFLALKGGDCADELKEASGAIKTLGGKVEKSIEYALPSGDRRTLVVVKKLASTPGAYPRASGKISAKPL